jgi:hypothetical protein
VSRIASRRPVAASKRASVLPAVVAGAIVLVASLPATRTWSQQAPGGGGQRLLFEPSALDARPGAFRPLGGSQPTGAAKPADEARKTPEPRSFAPLQANGALALPHTPRPATKFGVAAGDRPEQTRLGLETEHRFRPDELPNGEKTHGLSYQRELHVKPFLGLSLTSPLE